MTRISNIGGGGSGSGLSESDANALYLNESANLSDLDSASAARTNLGLAIGTNVQAWSSNLDEYSAVNPTAAGLALLDDANAAAQLATLGLDADIATLSLPSSTTISTFGASLIDDAAASNARTTLGLGTMAVEPEANYYTTTEADALLAAKQPLDSDLTTLAANITAAGHALVDDADAATQRTTLGLVAAGAGDIWVEKAGDTMTGNLVIDADHFLNIDGSVIFNETGADADFRIEGDTDTLLFNTEATANNVGIGIVPVTAKLHVKAAAGSIAKFGDGTSDARFEMLRDTGAGAVMLFHAGDAIMESDGNWQLKHEGGSKIKMKNSTNGAEVWVDTTTPSIYTGGGDNLILGRNQTTILTLVAAGATLVGDLDASGVLKIDNVQVISNRVVDARIDDTINTTVWDSTTAGVLDALRDAAITHGWLAAA